MKNDEPPLVLISKQLLIACRVTGGRSGEGQSGGQMSKEMGTAGKMGSVSKVCG